jgi:hypothetical protein
MNLTTYFLIGFLFTFMVEHLAASTFKGKIKPLNFGFWERFLSVLFWPLLLVTFLYNFFKSYLEL